MKVMGITSSIIDVISFIIFWFVLGYNSIDKQAYFQTAWFITCLVTELMIIYNVRTSKKPFIESNASHKLNVLTIFSANFSPIPGNKSLDKKVINPSLVSGNISSDSVTLN